jgi:hypothetical protein
VTEGDEEKRKTSDSCWALHLYVVIVIGLNMGHEREGKFKRNFWL